MQQLLPFFPSIFNTLRLIYFILKKKKEKKKRCAIYPMMLFSDQPRFFFFFFFFFFIGWRLKPRFFSVQSDFLKKWYFLSSHLVSIHCSCSILGKVSSDILLFAVSVGQIVGWTFLGFNDTMLLFDHFWNKSLFFSGPVQCVQLPTWSHLSCPAETWSQWP